MPVVIEPDWAVSSRVHAFFSTRLGGESRGGFSSLNLGLHVGDSIEDVLANRALLPVPTQPVWLDQVHSSRCVDAGQEDLAEPIQADAAFTTFDNQVLSVMAADCLPVLLSTKDGSCVAAIHAGWRGLANGIIAETARQLPLGDWHAWLGPAIGACHYEVGPDVRSAFSASTGFFPVAGERWMMDLYSIAQQQLKAVGVLEVGGGNFCTFCDEERFFSYRRDGITGRMAGLIWKEPPG